MAKRSRSPAGVDVPGIFTKRKPIPLRVAGRRLTKAESAAADKAFNELANLPSWREQFDALGPELESASHSDDHDISMAAQRALHIWRSIVADLSKTKSKRRSAEWYTEWAMRLRWYVDKTMFWPFDDVVRSRNKSLRGLTSHNAKRQAEKETRREKLRREAEEAIETVKQNHPRDADRLDFIKDKAAKKLGIKKRALNERLKV